MKPKTPRNPLKNQDSDLLKVPRQTENVRMRRGSVNLEVPTIRVYKERTP